ncbi:hypothetical protein, partial [Erwinia aphidicola]|uniref:hypothetical protein n=1 Tax=Erwinia aphidicola TaxID=68334 RepID=UPI00301962F1
MSVALSVSAVAWWALSALCFTVAVNCSMLAAVSSSAAPGDVGSVIRQRRCLVGIISIVLHRGG